LIGCKNQHTGDIQSSGTSSTGKVQQQLTLPKVADPEAIVDKR
jgi:hypothetical protein